MLQLVHLLKNNATTVPYTVWLCVWIKNKIIIQKTLKKLKMLKNAYFMLKTLFILKIFTSLSWCFGHVVKQFDKKDEVNSKICNVTDWVANKTTDSCRDGWNVRKVQESFDVIMKNWFYGLSLMSKHSCCQSKKWLFELFHLCAVKSKVLP